MGWWPIIMKNPLENISQTIANLRNQIEHFSDSINSAIERSGTTPELSVRAFFYKKEDIKMPSRLFQGEGICSPFRIDSSGVGMILKLKKGGSYIPHKHHDAIEIIHVNMGLVLEVISGQIIKPGQEFRADAGVLHQYKILEDSQIVTTFIFI